MILSRLFHSSITLLATPRAPLIKFIGKRSILKQHAKEATTHVKTISTPVQNTHTIPSTTSTKVSNALSAHEGASLGRLHISLAEIAAIESGGASMV